MFKRLFTHKHDTTFECWLKIDKWFHIAVVETRWRTRFYVNGKQVRKKVYHKRTGGAITHVDQRVVWNVRKSREELVAALGKEYDGSEADLYSMFKFDPPGGDCDNT